jgi:hypothetical protein
VSWWEVLVLILGIVTSPAILAVSVRLQERLARQGEHFRNSQRCPQKRKGPPGGGVQGGRALD